MTMLTAWPSIKPHRLRSLLESDWMNRPAHTPDVFDKRTDRTRQIAHQCLLPRQFRPLSRESASYTHCKASVERTGMRVKMLEVGRYTINMRNECKEPFSNFSLSHSVLFVLCFLYSATTMYVVQLLTPL